MAEEALDRICSAINRRPRRLSSSNSDGRINSIANEDELRERIETLISDQSWFVENGLKMTGTFKQTTQKFHRMMSGRSLKLS